MPRVFWNPNSLILPLSPERVRLFQPVTRRNVVGESGLVELVLAATKGVELGEWRATFEKRFPEGIRAADATTFTLWDHSYRNSDFFDEATVPVTLPPMSFDEFFEMAAESSLFTPGEEASYQFEKKSFTDRYKGSFYEQVGTEALFNRVKPTDWWTAQKFEADYLETRPTPYRYIQDNFLKGYFEQSFKGKDVLEIGCGTGYYTRTIAKSARLVAGIDYNPDYVKIANERWHSPNLEFHVGDMTDISAWPAKLTRERFDSIILIDTFLFLFSDKYQQNLYERRHQILENIGSLLRPKGSLVIFDPHPFWLTPWYGQQDHPVGLLTEYKNRRFKVIPTLEELTTLLSSHSFFVNRILEPGPSEELRKVDPAAYHFMSEFPQWWCIEAGRASD